MLTATLSWLFTNCLFDLLGILYVLVVEALTARDDSTPLLVSALVAVELVEVLVALLELLVLLTCWLGKSGGFVTVGTLQFCVWVHPAPLFSSILLSGLARPVQVEYVFFKKCC